MEDVFKALVASVKKVKEYTAEIKKDWKDIASSAKGVIGGGGSGGLASGQSPNGGNVAPKGTANFGGAGRFLGASKLLGGAGDIGDFGGGGAGRRAAWGAGKGALAGAAALVAYNMPDRGEALDYRLARANGAFQMGGLGISMADRNKYVSGMQRKAMSAGTSMGNMDAVNAQRTLASGGFGPGSMNYNTMLSSGVGLSNLMPGLSINGGAQVAMNFQSGRVTNEMRMYGIQTSNARTGKAYGMNVIGEQLYQKVMDRQRQLGVTDSKEQQRRINFSLEKDRNLDRMITNMSGGDEASKEALKTMLQYRMQTGSKSLTLLDKNEQEKLGIQTDDTKSQSKLNSRSFNSLQSQSKGLAEGFRDLNSAVGTLQNSIAKMPSLLGRLEGGLASIVGGVGGAVGGGALRALLGGGSRGGVLSVLKATLMGGGRAAAAGEAAGAGAVGVAGVAASAGIAALGAGAAFEIMQMMNSAGRGKKEAAKLGDDLKALKARKAQILKKYGGGGFGLHDLKKGLPNFINGNLNAGSNTHEELLIINAKIKNLTKDPNNADGIPTANSGVNTRGFQESLSGPLDSMMGAAQQRGLSISVFSGYRSQDRQNQLYADALKKYGSESAARKMVAKVSRHTSGQAADLQYGSGAARSWAHANAKNFGLTFPMSWENWHIEPIGARKGGKVAAGKTSQATSSAAAISTGTSSGTSSGTRSSGSRGFSVGPTNDVLNQMNSNSGVSNSYDCSSYVQEIMKKNGISLPDTSWEQAKKGTQVPNITDAQKGDLLFFHFANGHKGDGSTNKINHVGIYVGEGRMTDYTKERGASTGYIPMSNLVMIRRVLASANAVGSSAAPSGAGGGGTAGSQVAAGGRSGGGSPKTYGTGATGRGTQLGFSDLLALAQRNGFKGDQARTIAAISMAESGGWTGAVGDVKLQNGKWGPSVGVAQVRTINAERGKGTVRDIDALLSSPELQMKAAWAISNHGKNFNPWTMYTNGGYKKYTEGAQTTSRAVGGWNIPQDEFSRLHAGEMVLPSKIAEAVRGAMKEGSGHPLGAATSGGASKVEVTLVIKGNNASDYDQALKGITSAINRSANYDMIRSS